MSALFASAWPWVAGAVAAFAFVTMLGMFVSAVRGHALERKRRRDAELAVDRMEDAREVYDLDDVDPDRVGDFWDGMRDD